MPSPLPSTPFPAAVRGRRLPPAPLVLLLAVAASQVAAPAGAQEAPRDDAELRLRYLAGEQVPALEILAAAAERFGAPVIPDPQVEAIYLRFHRPVDRDLTWLTVKQLLDFHDVVVVEHQPIEGGPFVIRAYYRRNLPTKSAPPWRYVDRAGEPEPALVTAVFAIEHGAGISILSAIRDVLNAQGVRRRGNVLYVQGPELIFVVDEAARIRDYEGVVRALDVAGPRGG